MVCLSCSKGERKEKMEGSKEEKQEGRNEGRREDKKKGVTYLIIVSTLSNLFPLLLNPQ